MTERRDDASLDERTQLSRDFLHLRTQRVVPHWIGFGYGKESWRLNNPDVRRRSEQLVSGFDWNVIVSFQRCQSQRNGYRLTMATVHYCRNAPDFDGLLMELPRGSKVHAIGRGFYHLLLDRWGGFAGYLIPVWLVIVNS